jgi:hypothetical protein
MGGRRSTFGEPCRLDLAIDGIVNVVVNENVDDDG